MNKFNELFEAYHNAYKDPVTQYDLACKIRSSEAKGWTWYHDTYLNSFSFNTYIRARKDEVQRAMDTKDYDKVLSLATEVIEIAPHEREWYDYMIATRESSMEFHRLHKEFSCESNLNKKLDIATQMKDSSHGGNLWFKNKYVKSPAYLNLFKRRAKKVSNTLKQGDVKRANTLALDMKKLPTGEKWYTEVYTPMKERSLRFSSLIDKFHCLAGDDRKGKLEIATKIRDTCGKGGRAWFDRHFS